MGLSIEERCFNIHRIISSMNKNKKIFIEIQNREHTHSLSNVIEITKLIDELWPVTLSKFTDSCFWFAGSQINCNDVFSDYESVIGSAFNNSYYMENVKSEELSSMEIYWPTSLEKIFSKDNERSFVSKTLELIEQYYYYCNRYIDEFSEKFKYTTAIISQIYGECYDILSKDFRYYQAWMGRVICEKFVLYHTDDIITKCINDLYLYHKVSIFNYKPKRLKKDFRFCQKYVSLSNMKKLYILSRLLKGMDPHIYEEFYKKFESYQNSLDKKDPQYKSKRINLCKLKGLFLKNEEKEETDYSFKYSVDLVTSRYFVKEDVYKGNPK